MRLVQQSEPDDVDLDVHLGGDLDHDIAGTGQRRSPGQRPDRLGGGQFRSGDSGGQRHRRRELHGDDQVTEVTPAALTDVTAGNCVTVRPARGGQAGQPVTAASVKVSPSVNGTCPKPKAAAPGGSPGPAPSGAPTPPPARPAPLGGSVASVTGNTINVTGTDPSGNTTQTAVTVDDKTKYLKQSSATTDAIAQGKCLTARGTKDSGGALQATSINVRPANDGKCGGPAKPPHAHG
ncbi:hypothetical protein ACKUT9_05670 [Mycobacterium seoulense]|uniref:DUF5666 domain-containing protein n=1 Tax=Mycobacterium seoulense TaxID=386911 RepID=UPI003CF907FB